jgi:serine/threonine-protein kinase HipA
MAGMTGNEFLCMRLASLVGIEVASVRLTHLPEPVLIIERFDRITSSDFKTVERLHVIDGCQALGLSPAMKYEKPFGVSRDVKHIRDGASLPMLFKLLKLSSQPALDRLKLLRWVIFQVLIGNTDAHAKNLSFFYGPDGLRLAPAYDLVCAPAFASVALDDEYAMGIGDAFTLKELSPLEWAEFANQCGLSKKLVATELARLSKRVLSELNKLEALATENLVSAAMAQAVTDYIQQTCQVQLVQAALITGVDSELLSLRH